MYDIKCFFWGMFLFAALSISSSLIYSRTCTKCPRLEKSEIMLKLWKKRLASWDKKVDIGGKTAIQWFFAETISKCIR